MQMIIQGLDIKITENMFADFDQFEQKSGGLEESFNFSDFNEKSFGGSDKSEDKRKKPEEKEKNNISEIKVHETLEDWI